MVYHLLQNENNLLSPFLGSFLLPRLSATGQCNIILSLLLKHPATNYGSRAIAAHQRACSNITVVTSKESLRQVNH